MSETPALETAALAIPQLVSTQVDFDVALQHRLHWSSETDAAIEQRVVEILADVQARGDEAVLDYTARFDRLTVPRATDLALSPDTLQSAFDALPKAQRHALISAAERLRHYHERQLEAMGRSWHYHDEYGSLLGQKVTPLDRVGIYVPGGKAAYPSSVLMNAIPAHVAGVGEIIMVVPTPGGEHNPLVLAAAHVGGVSQAFTIGGAQAIAALAYGTATVPQVDKITGPGNAYVASAKKRVFGTVGIDMIAGPSEILILADGSTPAQWVAMDLFSQAEHDELAQSILLCPDANYLDAVRDAMHRLLPTLPRAAIIRASLEGRGLFVHTRDMAEACALANRIAPEHLEVSTREPHQWEPLLRHAGALFLGAYTSESLGDYCAGPNHVLPTSGTARFSSPLGVGDFQKRSSLIEVSATGAQALGPIADELARGEGLHAHAHAATLRYAASAQSSPPTATPRKPSLTERMGQVLCPAVQSLNAYAVPSSEGMIKLDAMENPFMLPTPLQNLLGQRLAQVALNRYPGSRNSDLINALSQYIDLPPGQALILGNGSDELIAMLATACARPGASLLTPQPGFVMYTVCSQLHGLRFVGVPLTARFELDETAMHAAIEMHRPALTFLAYPHNPSANLFDDAVIQRLIDHVGQQNGLIVIDEAYQPFASRTWLHRAAEHEHVLVMRTLSKLGLAGIRLGYLVGAAALIAQIDKVRPPYNVSALNAEAALFALEHAPEYARQAAIIQHERECLIHALITQFVDIEVFPSEANMVLVRMPDAGRIFSCLKARGILVKYVAGDHPLLDNCLRLTVGTPAENMALISALRIAVYNP